MSGITVTKTEPKRNSENYTEQTEPPDPVLIFQERDNFVRGLFKVLLCWVPDPSSPSYNLTMTNLKGTGDNSDYGS